MSRLIHSVKVLERLEKEAIDQLRIEISLIDGKINKINERIKEINVQLSLERTIAVENMQNQNFQRAYFKHAKKLIKKLFEEKEELEIKRQEFMNELQEHYRNQKSHEKIIEHINKKIKEKQQKIENENLNEVGLQIFRNKD